MSDPAVVSLKDSLRISLTEPILNRDAESACRMIMRRVQLHIPHLMFGDITQSTKPESNVSLSNPDVYNRPFKGCMQLYGSKLGALSVPNNNLPSHYLQTRAAPSVLNNNPPSHHFKTQAALSVINNNLPSHYLQTQAAPSVLNNNLPSHYLHTLRADKLTWLLIFLLGTKVFLTLIDMSAYIFLAEQFYFLPY